MPENTTYTNTGNPVIDTFPGASENPWKNCVNPGKKPTKAVVRSPKQWSEGGFVASLIFGALGLLLGLGLFFFASSVVTAALLVLLPLLGFSIIPVSEAIWYNRKDYKDKLIKYNSSMNETWKSLQKRPHGRGLITNNYSMYVVIAIGDVGAERYQIVECTHQKGYADDQFKWRLVLDEAVPVDLMQAVERGTELADVASRAEELAQTRYDAKLNGVAVDELLDKEAMLLSKAEAKTRAQAIQSAISSL